MHNKRLFIALWVATALSANGAPFALDQVSANIAVGPNTLFISTKGDPPTTAELTDLTNPANWSVLAKSPDSKAGYVKQRVVGLPRWTLATKQIELDLDPKVLPAIHSIDAILGGEVNATNLLFEVRYQGGATIEQVSPPTSASGYFKPATSKENADLYLSGTFLAGYGTKPLYAIDVKLNWFPTAFRLWLVGISGEFSANAKADPPVDRSRIDPDAVKGSLLLQRQKRLAAGPMYGLRMDVEPVRGEFSRKEAYSNLIHSAKATVVSRRLQQGKTYAGLDPVAGLEFGTNLNRPASFLGVDNALEGYHRIARGVAGANGYFAVADSNEDSANRFAIELNWMTRLLMTNEPFIRNQYGPDGARVQILELKRGPRHTVEAAIKYALNNGFGIEVKYFFGVKPPLFGFVDHQFSVGFVIQKKLRTAE